ncbi:beta-galactosidase-like protein [Marinilabilia salmonicolor]|jgi:beta-galactosidase GanA|uniref:GH35 family beta-galactosidase n=1 Tax=Marinilabilia salmonicolor TaxID=989 RepID=UPI000D4286DE|nr:beta-galactosidase [Marinilabilia salmonicolor]PRZ02128.1 beta-galactosidase-like protein [Marinilabilia salmonicolor]
MFKRFFTGFVILLLMAPSVMVAQKDKIPYLAFSGETTQLMVDDAPWLMLGGELGNSSASDPEFMAKIWPDLNAMKLNTVLAPVYWELVEPVEGEFDFSSVDQLINQARKYDTKLVLLWFGSWKNSMSCYAPLWVKKDWKRFPRSKTKEGKPLEILTPFSRNNLEADKEAFVKLMEFLKEKDSDQNTVIMVQVENEIGMIPQARDYHSEANKVFNQEVPQQIIGLLKEDSKETQDHLSEMWNSNGEKVAGDWEDVFGESLYADELFMAWHFAKYAGELAQAGKNVYPLPMYVNAALNSRGRKPGEYPSAGPLAHLIDVWKLGAPAIDVYALDIYDAGFNHWCNLYHLPNNPLFIPEIRNEPGNHARVFYAFGEHDALGFSPFSIEDTTDPANAPLTKSYDILHQLMPLLAEKQGEQTAGVWFNNERRDTSFVMGNYRFHFKHDYTLVEAGCKRWVGVA